MSFDKIQTWFITIWLWLVFALTLMSFAGTMISAPSVWEGLSTIRDEVSPFNYRFYTTILLLSSPALLVVWWRGKRRKKMVAKPMPSTD